jgi:hypothetical protein
MYKALGSSSNTGRERKRKRGREGRREEGRERN